MVVGFCRSCGMAGLLQPKVVIDASDPRETYDSGDVPRMLICITCFDTPTGLKSENVTHKRLAAKEYEAECARINAEKKAKKAT
jgi:hypothetical protein